MSVTDPSSSGFRPRVMIPYKYDPDVGARRWAGGLGLTAVIGFAFVYGAAFAFAGMALPLLFAIPLAVLGGLVMWTLPASRAPPRRTLVFLFYVFFFMSVAWPNYLALTVPGLPRIYVYRLTGVPLVFTFLICLSSSASFRDELREVIGNQNIIARLIIAFVAVEFLSIILSIQKSSSADHFINAQISWTSIYFISAYVFSKPGRINAWIDIAWVAGLIACIVGVAENRVHHVLWLGHIPVFLGIDGAYVEHYLAGSMRAGDGIHRVQSVFSGPIQFGEFIALTLPFVIHRAIYTTSQTLRLLLAFLIILLIYNALITHSRSGMIGTTLSILIFVLIFGWIQWRRHPASLIGPTIVLSYPVFATAAAVIAMSVGSIRKLLLGGGAAQGSSVARIEQWKMGIPKIISHPWGYGMSMGGNALGWVDATGFGSIDSYYLSVILEYGVLGFIIYYGTFYYAIYSAARSTVDISVEDPEKSAVAPIAVSLIGFAIIKTVFSEQDNHSIAFMLLGMLTALQYRNRREQRVNRLIPPRPKVKAAAPRLAKLRTGR